MRTPSRATKRENYNNSKAFLTELADEISKTNPDLVQELERIAKGRDGMDGLGVCDITIDQVTRSINITITEAQTERLSIRSKWPLDIFFFLCLYFF